MKPTTLLMAIISPLAMFAAAHVFAQEALTEIPAVAPAPSQLERQAKTRPVARSRRSSRAHMDARHCLDLQTNRAIIKCAEKFL